MSSSDARHSVVGIIIASCLQTLASAGIADPAELNAGDLEAPFSISTVPFVMDTFMLLLLEVAVASIVNTVAMM